VKQKGLVIMKLISLASLLLTTAALGVAPVALADTAPTEAAALQQGHAVGASVSVAGEVGRYVVGPLGHVRGFILKDGTAVMVHDTAGDAMAKEVAVGQSVRVEGQSPAGSGGKLIFRPTVYGLHGVVVSPAAGRGGRGGDPAARQQKRAEMRAELAKLPAVSASGTVQSVIPGRRGQVEGVVLTDGTSVFLRHGLVKAMGARTIRVGDRIASTGKGAAYPLGTSVLAGSVTFSDGTRFEARAKAAPPATPASETL
jgi:hypothetical protein